MAASVSHGTEHLSISNIPGMSSIAALDAQVRNAVFDLVQAGETESLEDFEAKVRAKVVENEFGRINYGIAASKNRPDLLN